MIVHHIVTRQPESKGDRMRPEPACGAKAGMNEMTVASSRVTCPACRLLPAVSGPTKEQP